VLPDNNPYALAVGDCPKTMNARLNPLDNLIDSVELPAETNGINSPVQVAAVSPNTGDLIVRHGTLPSLGDSAA
jgi:hypothetical protein